MPNNNGGGGVTPWCKTGATLYHAHFRLPGKNHAIILFFMKRIKLIHYKGKFMLKLNQVNFPNTYLFLFLLLYKKKTFISRAISYFNDIFTSNFL